MSDILFSLREHVDLSSYIPTPRKRSLIFEELIEKTGYSEERLKAEMNLNKSAPGKFGPEFPKTNSFLAIPRHFLSIREKVYFLEVAYKENAESELASTSKSASRCEIKKKHMAQYSLDDYQRMSDATKINYAKNLVSFQSKEFEIHKVTVNRAEPSVFTRKKFQLSNRTSYPFHYYKNFNLNCQDEI